MTILRISLHVALLCMFAVCAFGEEQAKPPAKPAAKPARMDAGDYNMWTLHKLQLENALLRAQALQRDLEEFEQRVLVGKYQISKDEDAICGNAQHDIARKGAKCPPR